MALNIQTDKTSRSTNLTKPKKINFAKRFDNNRELVVKLLMKNQKQKIDIKENKIEFFADKVQRD